MWNNTEPSEVIIHQGVYPGDVRVGNNEDRLGGTRPHLLIRAAERDDGGFRYASWFRYWFRYAFVGFDTATPTQPKPQPKGLRMSSLKADGRLFKLNLSLASPAFSQQRENSATAIEHICGKPIRAFVIRWLPI